MTWTYDKYLDFLGGLIEQTNSNNIGIVNFEKALMAKFGMNSRTRREHKKAMSFLGLIQIRGGTIEMIPSSKADAPLTAEEKAILHAGPGV